MAKNFETPLPYEALVGKKVRVFKNLHNGLYSIQHKGIIIAHVAEVSLEEVTFSVQPAGRERVLRTKQKQIHAFVNGVVCPISPASQRRVSYNPYKGPSFVLAGVVPTPITAASTATITSQGVFI
jgi:hypothetical protein